MPRGGKREGAGRKSKAYGTVPTTKRSLRLTDEELVILSEVVEALRTSREWIVS